MGVEAACGDGDDDCVSEASLGSGKDLADWTYEVFEMGAAVIYDSDFDIWTGALRDSRYVGGDGAEA